MSDAPVMPNGDAADGSIANGDAPNNAPQDSSSSNDTGGNQPNDSSTLPDVPEGCNPDTDLACMKLPNGWFLWALALYPVGSGPPPDCPNGFDTPSNMGENPTADADACICDCRVASPATCSGEVTGAVSGAPPCLAPIPPGTLANSPNGACIASSLTLFPAYQRFSLPAAVGGTCAVDPAEEHPENVTWGQRSRVCRNDNRCDDGTCDARVDGPFKACIARQGDVACDQPGWSVKQLMSEDAYVECSNAGCGCTVSRSCTGSVAHYTDAACTTGEVRVNADGVCRASTLNATAIAAYRVTMNAQTSCNETGTATATEVGLASPRTVCCKP